MTLLPVAKMSLPSPKTETPKVFASVSSLPGSFQVESGTSELTGQSVVIGSSEAKMMKEEGLFKNVEMYCQTCSGQNVTVRGILKPTGTLADSYHFLSPNALRILKMPPAYKLSMKPMALPRCSTS